MFKEGPIRKRLRERGFLKRGLLAAPQENVEKKLCLDVVDALDEVKHLLSDAYTLYEEGFRDLALGRKHDAYHRARRAISLVRGAADKAEGIRRRAIAEGAPEVVTREDIDFVREKFNAIASIMEKGLKPPEELVYLVPPDDIEDLIYDVDGELYERMFQKFHQCMLKGREAHEHF